MKTACDSIECNNSVLCLPDVGCITMTPMIKNKLMSAPQCVQRYLLSLWDRTSSRLFPMSLLPQLYHTISCMPSGIQGREQDSFLMPLEGRYGSPAANWLSRKVPYSAGGYDDVFPPLFNLTLSLLPPFLSLTTCNQAREQNRGLMIH